MDLRWIFVYIGKFRYTGQYILHLLLSQKKVIYRIKFNSFIHSSASFHCLLLFFSLSRSYNFFYCFDPFVRIVRICFVFSIEKSMTVFILYVFELERSFSPLSSSLPSFSIYALEYCRPYVNHSCAAATYENCASEYRLLNIKYNLNDEN